MAQFGSICGFTGFVASAYGILAHFVSAVCTWGKTPAHARQDVCVEWRGW